MIYVVNQGYYRLLNNSDCNIKVTDSFLTVNCAGIYSMSQPFESNNIYGRKDIYLMYLFEGKLDIYIDGIKRSLNAGDIALYPQDKPYRYTKTGEENLTYYWLHFSGYGTEELLSQCGFKEGNVYTLGCDSKLVAKIVSSFKHLFQYFYLHEVLFELNAAAQLVKILTLMADDMNKSVSMVQNISTKRISVSLEYLYCNYSQPITLSQLASLEHLSLSRYSAVFKQCMGVSPQGFLLDLRMKNAADLIRKTDLSIKQIAKSVGYDDPLYFSGLFKRRIGMTPSKYQAENGLNS